jgi:hypothetical protein
MFRLGVQALIDFLALGDVDRALGRREIAADQVLVDLGQFRACAVVIGEECDGDLRADRRGNPHSSRLAVSEYRDCSSAGWQKRHRPQRHRRRTLPARSAAIILAGWQPVD